MSNINHNFSELVELISTLRSEDGCPWDRKQTHESLKRNLIEECYEVLESIENKDTQGIIEELGDVLLQIMFHAQIISEKEDFSITDVIDGLMDKMIRRHPHVFGDASADSAEQVEQNWEALKAKEKAENEKIYQDLYKDKESIEKKWKQVSDNELLWIRDEEVNYRDIRVKSDLKIDFSTADEELKKKCMDWFIENMKKFEDVFTPIVNELSKNRY